MSTNTLGPSFQIDLATLIKSTDLFCAEGDSKQVANVIKRHMSPLKKVSFCTLRHVVNFPTLCVINHLGIG